jgi:hypothetical protein
MFIAIAVKKHQAPEERQPWIWDRWVINLPDKHDAPLGLELCSLSNPINITPRCGLIL